MMPCCVCGFDKRIVSTVPAAKKIFFLHYPGEKSEAWVQWTDSIQKFKPGFQPPKKGAQVCSQHFVDDLKLPTVISNQILPPKSNGESDRRRSIPVRMGTTAVAQNGPSTSLRRRSTTGFEADHQNSRASSATPETLKCNMKPTLKLERCKEPANKGVMCMEHWIRGCVCLAQAQVQNNAAAESQKIDVPPAAAPRNLTETQTIVKPAASAPPKDNLSSEAEKFVTPPSSPIAGSSTGVNKSTTHITISCPDSNKSAVPEPKDKAAMTHVIINIPVEKPMQPLRCSTPKPRQSPPAAPPPVKSTVELSGLLNNKQLMADLIREVSSTNPDEPLDLKKSALTITQSRLMDQRYLLVDWKRFHRSYQQGKLHIRIRFDPAQKNGVFIVYVLPIDGTTTLNALEDPSTEDIQKLAGHPNLPLIVKELLKPTVEPSRLKNKYFAALYLCPGSGNKWKLLSCIHLMSPAGYMELPKPLNAAPVPAPTPSTSGYSIPFPSVGGCELIRKESLRWKVTFDIPVRPNAKATVLLPLPERFLQPDKLQWWMVATNSIPDFGLPVSGLTEGGKRATVLNIPSPLLKKTASTSVEKGVSTFLRLETHFKETARFLTPCCIYGWPKLAGFIIMGPLPAQCPLPAGSPWVMRIPLSADKHNTKEDTKTNGTANGSHLQAEEVLLVRHDVFLPGGRIFESVETAQQWILTLTEALNLPGGFQCYLNDVDPILPPLDALPPSLIDNDKFESVEKIPLGTISWQTGAINIPIVGRKLIRVRHSLPTTTGANFSLFRTSEEVENFAESIQEGFVYGGIDLSLHEPRDPIMFEPIVQIDSADDDVIFDGILAVDNGSAVKRARFD